MTTNRELPTPPGPSPSWSFPSMHSPTKRDPALKPNPHPYAIKTTSTGLLTRSGSSGHNVDSAHHYYVPLSPTQRRNLEKGTYHRHSKSARSVEEEPTSISPRPLPLPPSITGSSNGSAKNNGHISAEGSHITPRRSKRAETLPSLPVQDPKHPYSLTLDDFPSDPKTWSPSQLAAYLTTALRVTSQPTIDGAEQAALPMAVVRDITTFLKVALINGRTFLRISEEDLDGMGVNRKWREVLLVASRNLRQNVLKGRIWGPDVDSTTSPAIIAPLPIHPFSSALYNSSSSSVDLASGDEESDKHSRGRRHGRVRGMVEKFERSGSFSSESSFDGDVADGQATIGRWLQDQGPMEENTSKSPNSECNSSLPPPPTYIEAPNDIVEEEPSIEDLLGASEYQGEKSASWGARAWEEMDLAPGVTARRIHGSAGCDRELETDPDFRNDESMSTVVPPESGRRGRIRDERRVVTAIFAPAHAETGTEVVHDSTQVLDPEQEHAVINDGIAQPSDAGTALDDVDRQETALERALRAELTKTRELLDIFRQRLEDVEHSVGELQESEARRQEEHEQWVSEMQHKVAADRQHDLLPTVDEDFCEIPQGSDSSASSTLFSQASSLIPSVVQQFTTGLAPLSNTKSPRDEDPGVEDNEPATASDLPAYVFMVGIGVCAVVLKVMLKRVAGRNGSLGWKP